MNCSEGMLAGERPDWVLFFNVSNRFCKEAASLLTCLKKNNVKMVFVVNIFDFRSTSTENIK